MIKLSDVRNSIRAYEATVTSDVTTEEALDELIDLCSSYYRQEILDEANKAMTLIMNNAPRHLTAEAQDLAAEIGNKFEEMKRG